TGPRLSARRGAATAGPAAHPSRPGARTGAPPVATDSTRTGSEPDETPGRPGARSRLGRDEYRRLPSESPPSAGDEGSPARPGRAAGAHPEHPAARLAEIGAHGDAAPTRDRLRRDAGTPLFDRS